MTRFITCLMLLLSLAAARASCFDEPLNGVNLSGGEFGKPKAGERWPLYPSPADIERHAQRGFNVFRVPIKWERVQPDGESLASWDVRVLNALVQAAGRTNTCIVVDLHNYGQRAGQPIELSGADAQRFADFWLALLAALPGSEEYLAADLMNEPAHMRPSEWMQLAQRAVTAIRRAGHRNLLLVSGGRWSGVHDWFNASRGDASNAELAATYINDPSGHTVLTLHQYADPYFSGKPGPCVPASRITAMFEKVSSWAQQRGFKLFLGEFGTDGSEECLAALKAIVAGSAAPPWIGRTYWSAGRFWNAYPFNIEDDSDESRARRQILLGGRKNPP